MVKNIGNLGDTSISAIADEAIEPGHQWIVIEDTPDGEALAGLLGGGAAEWQPAEGWRIPHDYAADARLMAMIDLLTDIRFGAPRMIQLTLAMGDEAE